jgi:hypothetical protein
LVDAQTPIARFLYLTVGSGAVSRTTQPIADFKAIGDKFLADRRDREVAEPRGDAEQATGEQTVGLPPPHSLRWLVGDLPDVEQVISGLGLGPEEFK